MGAFLSELSADARIIALASRHHGVVYRQQLLAAGVSRRQIERRLKDGRLEAIHAGVYLVGPVPPELAYPQAALFACGRSAALGCHSALSVWKLLRYPPRAEPWVTIPPERRIARRGIVITRAPLPACDRRMRCGMPVVSPARAILDYAGVAPDPYSLEWLVAEGHFRRLAREPELRAVIERNSGRPGVGALRRILDLEGGFQRTRSGGERWFLRLLRENGIGGFEVNARIHGWEVDFLWRDAGVVIELDGWDGHSSRTAFEKDRRKWADLTAHGLTVVPLAVREARRDEPKTIRLVTGLLK